MARDKGVKAVQRGRSGRPDTQERRLRVKRVAAELAARLEAHGARTELGRTTATHSSVEVRQERRHRMTVDVEIVDDAPLYTITQEGQTVEYFDVEAVRRVVIAPPQRWNRWWAVAVVVVAWVLVAIGVAVVMNEVNWLVLGGVFVAGSVVSFALGSLIRRWRRWRIERGALSRMGIRR